jgi:phytoene dehydrogenase-like protein
MNSIREAVETEITGLRRQRGAARLDGRKFDDSAISEAETKLEALQDAETERVRREREAAAKAWQAKRKELLEQRAHQVELYLEDVAAMEAGARQFLAGRDAALGRADNIIKLTVALDTSVPLALSRSSITSRLSGYFAALMSSSKEYKRQFGGISWTGGSLYSAVTSWVASENKHIKTIIKD